MLYLFFAIFSSLLSLASTQELPPHQALNRWSGSIEVLHSKTEKEILRVTTEGTGKPSYISWNLAAPIDMTKHFVQAFIKISSLEAWHGLELRLSDGNDPQSFIAIPLLKYSDTHFNWVQPGGWLRVTLPMGEGRMTGTTDIKKIQQLSWYINDTGSEAAARPLEVLFSGVGVVEAKKTALLSVTFDDGYAETLDAAKIMAPLGLRGTAYIIHNYVGRKDHLSSSDVSELNKIYRWGISAHHEISFTDFSPGRLATELETVLEYLVEHAYGFSAPHMAYPLGRFDVESVLPLTRQNYMTARIAGGGGETLPPADWHRLRAVNITPQMTPEILRERIKQAQLHKEWLILMFHRFHSGTPENDLQYNVEEFKKLMQVVHESGITTLPVHEVWEIHRVD